MIYIIMMYRWGEETAHSYLLGWSKNKNKAKSMANTEYEYRGCGKYSAVVYGMKSNSEDKQEIYRKGE